MKVLLRLDPYDGNDPIENEIELPALPREGDRIEVWDADYPAWLLVDGVVFTAYAPDRIEVWVRAEDTYDGEQAERLVRNATVTP